MKEKKCWKCKRIVVGKRTLGLCPKCANSLGTGAGVVITALLMILGVGAGSGKGGSGKK